MTHKLPYDLPRERMRKTELASRYSPHTSPGSARRNLLRWMKMNPELMERLGETGYKDSQRYFTPRQVGIIYEMLGEP